MANIMIAGALWTIVYEMILIIHVLEKRDNK